MGVFNEHSVDHPFSRGIQGAPGVGFRLTDDGNYDITGKRLTNVGDPTSDKDAATKKYVDNNASGGTTSSLTVDADIDMKDRYRILNLKSPLDADEPATKQYSDSKFLDRDGSRTMIGNLSMNNNKIISLKAPSNNNDAATKKYVDDKPFLLSGNSAMQGKLQMGNNLITGMNVTPVNSGDVTSKHYCDTKFYTRDGSVSLTADLNIAGHRIKNLRTPTENSEVATKKYVDDVGRNFLKKDGTIPMTGNLNMNSKNINNVSDPSTDDQAANRGWVRKQIERFDHHSGDLINERGIFNITDPSATPTNIYLQYVSGGPAVDFVFTTSPPGQALVGWEPKANTFINKIEFQFGSKQINVDYLWFIPRDSSKPNLTYWISGVKTGTWELRIQTSWPYDMSGVKLRTHSTSFHSINCRVFTGQPRAVTKPLERLEFNTPNIIISGVVKSDINLDSHKITNLGKPTLANDAANKDYVDKVAHVTSVQPSHYNDQFGYLMSSGSQWTDETNGGNSFLIDRIADLSPSNGNFHNYNHKVIYYKINKNSQGGYNYKMGMNFYRLIANTEYTLSIELLNTDYQLWHKSQISVDKGSSTGLSIGNVSIRKLSHRYTNSGGQTQAMYYHRMIINFQKLSSGNRFFLHISVNIPQSGTDLAIFPRLFTGVDMIAYGIVGTFSNIDPDKVYDYHTAFDISPTEVKYNVDINLNHKTIKNIKLDPNDATSAATNGQITEMSKFGLNNIYRTFFEEFYDFSDAQIYGLNKGVLGVIINSAQPNITIPNKDLSSIGTGLLISNYKITFQPQYSSTYTLCIVFKLKANKDFYLTKDNSQDNMALMRLTYSSYRKVLNLIIGRTPGNLSLSNDFIDKTIVLWLAANFNKNTTKLAISNYSQTITLNAVQYNGNQKWDFLSKDAEIYKLMYSTKFYDTDSDEYHKIMLQEKLNGTYVT